MNNDCSKDFHATDIANATTNCCKVYGHLSTYLFCISHLLCSADKHRYSYLKYANFYSTN